MVWQIWELGVSGWVRSKTLAITSLCFDGALFACATWIYFMIFMGYQDTFLNFLACSPLLALAVSWGRISVSKWFMMCLEKLGTALRLWRVQLMFLRFPKATGSCGGSSIRGTRESEARACGAHGAHGAHGARINGSNGPRAGVATREDLPELKAPELPKEARTPRKIEPVEGSRHRSYNVEVCRSHLLYLGHRNSKESNDIKCDFIRFLLGFVWNFFGWHSTHALLRRKDLRQNWGTFSGAMQRRWRWVQMGLGWLWINCETQRISWFHD